MNTPGCFGGGHERGGSSGDRRPGNPGARCEARQDLAPRDRGTGGRTATRQGADRRTGAKVGRCIGSSLPLRVELSPKVKALSMAMSMLATRAPSILWKATRFLPASH